MKTQTVSAKTLGEDLRQWDEEHLGWMTDIQRWRINYFEAQETLLDFLKRLTEYGRELEEHSSIIAAHQQRLPDERREIDEYQRLGHELYGEFHTPSLDEAHHEDLKQHGSTREKHRMMENRHSQIMALLSRLMSATGTDEVPSE